MMAFEANFDGLVGPTHHYGGHSFGNVASTGNAGHAANPRAAALQGLSKMKALADLGYRQGILPPQERPAVAELRKLGFAGSDAAVIAAAAQTAPALLASVSSASSMWTANAGTVSPSADTADGRVHFTVANLQNKFHRAIEHEQTARTLRAVFRDDARFAVHDALPMHPALGDEGAANHTRFARQYGERGVEFFVYGRRHWGGDVEPVRYPARQTLEACQAVARLHGLAEQHVVYAQQNPAVIDAGVFHNDVIAVGNLDVLFCHQQAFLHQQPTYAELERKLGGLRVVEVPNAAVSVADAVKSYLFNSQLLDLGDGSMRLVVPEECRNTPAVWQWLQGEVKPGAPISELLVFDLKQSMQNGGGPACLRLRVVLNEAEAAAVAHGVWMNEARHAMLTAWVEKHYRDRLSEADLADPQLLVEVRTALDELTALLGLGSIYPFQLN
ncbi:succinylarginine dihydrolase [Andreprevotia lacus DSM 23236]|jgi:succinylarginine dihydrolase|uniref:N-succinylarginine dihydrolase n=1 Tax=Andreprevotia lacus DSM 23236 TaxID=1121001 RepID=A0A1W1XET7_9NEIS|nr:N-succinylarginine dihydrolase [Andreprevotia lacus]SMC22031.1 succinylarginine dihydrolase [Andreprevotia lacus DSM 23236]